VKFNINDTVRVRLTDHGRAVLRDGWQSTTDTYFATPEQLAIRGEYKPPKEDAHGWSEWQLWALMEAFGEHTGLGCRLAFETEIEISRAELAQRTAERDALVAENAALKPQSNADEFASIPLKAWVVEVFQHLCHSPHTPDEWKRDLDKKTIALLNAIEQGKKGQP
jgi:hypothetical protein